MQISGTDSLKISANTPDLNHQSDADAFNQYGDGGGPDFTQVDQIIEKFANRKSGLDRTSIENWQEIEQNHSSLESRLEGMEDPFKDCFMSVNQ